MAPLFSTFFKMSAKLRDPKHAAFPPGLLDWLIKFITPFGLGP